MGGDGAPFLERELRGAGERLVEDVATASRLLPLSPGDAFASAPLAPGEHRLWPGARVEMAVDGLGVLVVRVGR
jgi:2-keto-4-pentenoate hydratase/2-oxohepta-3-ene-1,7-dioic acid hydratase in catechol pathway